MDGLRMNTDPQEMIDHTLERYLIEHQGYDDYDAWLRVSYDKETVKREWKIYNELRPEVII